MCTGDPLRGFRELVRVTKPGGVVIVSLYNTYTRSEFMIHYHEERNHQSLNNEVIVPVGRIGETEGVIRRKARLGGMLNYYYRLAA